MSTDAPRSANISEPVRYDTARQASVGYLIIIGTLGIIGNSLVIVVFWKYSKLRTATNLFILNLAFCDLAMSILDNTFSIVSSLNSRWMFEDSGCLGYGFLHYFFISNTVSTLAAIAIDRFFYITKPGQIKAWRITRTRAGIILLIIYIYVLLFTFPPLAGWNSFVEEKDFFSGCYINYGDQNPASMAYSVIASICLYLVPLIVMICCYSRIFTAVRKSTQRTMSRSATSTPVSIRKRYPLLKRTHVQTAKMIVVVIFFSMIVWVPYVVVSLIKAFTGDAIISSLTSHVTILVAKSCVIYNVLIYVVLNRKLKAAIIDLLCCGRAIDFVGSSKAPTGTKLRISRILSETDREVPPEIIRNRLSALAAQEENGSAVNLDKPSTILRNSAYDPELKQEQPTRFPNPRNGNTKTVEFIVDTAPTLEDEEEILERTGSAGNRSSAEKMKRTKLSKIQRKLKENQFIENGVVSLGVGKIPDGNIGGGNDSSNDTHVSQRTTSPTSGGGKHITKVRTGALRTTNGLQSGYCLPNFSGSDRNNDYSSTATRKDLDSDDESEVFESLRIINEAKQHSRLNLVELGGLDTRQNNKRREIPIKVSAGKAIRQQGNQLRTNNGHNARDDSSSTALPSSVTSTLSNRSSGRDDSSSAETALGRCSSTAPTRKHSPRKSRKLGHKESRNASLRARLQRVDRDPMQASQRELHEIQNYWKRMSLCLDDIDLDEKVDI